MVSLVERDRSVQREPNPAAFALLAAGALGLTLWFSFGYDSGAGFVLAGLGVAALLAGTVALGRAPPRHAGVAAGLVGAAALATSFLVSDEAWSYFVQRSPDGWMPQTAKVLFLATFVAVAAGAWRDSRALSLVRLTALATAFLVGAVWTFRQSPVPGIDVWHLHTAAAKRLLHLQDPYTLSIPNPYRPGTIDFYPYPPVTLLVQTPFQLLFSDVRYAAVACLWAAAWCAHRMARLAGLPFFAADAAALLVLAQGRTFYVLEQGWTEPVVVGLVAVAAWVWVVRPAVGGPLLAVAFASKQFLWLFLPALLRLRGFGRQAFARAAIVVSALFVPFLVWEARRFWHGVVVVHLKGGGADVAYPGLKAGEPWPNANTVALHLLRRYDVHWPTWMGYVGWVAAALTFTLSRERRIGGLLVALACSVGLLGYLGTAFLPNYIWLLPQLALLGLLAGLAAEANHSFEAVPPTAQ